MQTLHSEGIRLVSKDLRARDTIYIYIYIYIYGICTQIENTKVQCSLDWKNNINNRD